MKTLLKRWTRSSPVLQFSAPNIMAPTPAKHEAGKLYQENSPKNERRKIGNTAKEMVQKKSSFPIFRPSEIATRKRSGGCSCYSFSDLPLTRRSLVSDLAVTDLATRITPSERPPPTSTAPLPTTQHCRHCPPHSRRNRTPDAMVVFPVSQAWTISSSPV